MMVRRSPHHDASLVGVHHDISPGQSRSHDMVPQLLLDSLDCHDPQLAMACEMTVRKAVKLRPDRNQANKLTTETGPGA